MSISLLTSTYAAIAFAQARAPYLLEALHDHEAMVLAIRDLQTRHNTTATEGMRYCDSLHELSDDFVSNCLQASAIVASLTLVIYAALAPSRWCSVGDRKFILLCVPPTWFLPSLVGHLVFQQDLPPFTGSTSLRAWILNEFCSFRSLFSGTIISTEVELAFTMLLTESCVLAALVKPGDDDQTESSTNRSRSKKAKGTKKR